MPVPISNVTRRAVYSPTGTGGAGPYAFTFEILANTDIAVYKDEVLLTLTTHYTVTINANGTGSVTITATGLALSPTSPTQYAIVGNRTISRSTDFTTGGDFFANTLNDELDQQTIFAQQNAEGLVRALSAPQTDPTSINMTLPLASLRANKTLGFDANGNPALGETLGTNRGNWAASTVYYVRDIVKDTTTNNIFQVITAHTSSGSLPITTNADSAKWTLLVDAASATTSATNAAASASAASTSASNASTSASNASTSATNAAASASTASTQASNASTSATAAAASASSATSSATSATSSASTATTQASNASTSASNASTSASNAATSETNAAASASTATTQASNASTSATNASNSATSASTSASTATTQATNASNSATSASTSATNASNSATAASTSATNAANSETAAANSATSAAAAAASGMYSAVQDKSANYTVVAGDAGDLIRVTTTSGAVTITLPTISTVSDGFKIAIVKWTGDANAVTVSRSSTNTINGATSVTIGAQYSSTIFVADFETNQWFAASSGLGTSNIAVDAFSGNNSTVAFTLSADPGSENNTQVYVSGVYQEKDTYSVSGTTLTFSTAPPTGTSNIEVVSSSPLAIGTPSDGTVTTAKLASTTGSGAVVLATSPTITTPVISSLSSASATALTLQSAGTTAITVDTSQNVGIGTTSPSGKLNVSDATSSQININSSASGATRQILFSTSTNTQEALISSNNSTGELKFESGRSGTSAYFQTYYTNNSERMRIDSSGNLLVGTTNTTKTNTGFRVESGVANTSRGSTGSFFEFYDTSSGSRVGYISNSGGTATLYNTTSDQRLKENIVDAPEFGSVIDSVKVRSFDWKSGGTHQRAGFIAQELVTVAPEAVNQPIDSEEMMAVDYSKLVPMLVKEIQSLRTRFATFETKSDTQAETINALTARITALEN